MILYSTSATLQDNFQKGCLSLVFIIALLFSHPAQAQDPNFSQFYNNPLYYNPGMAGVNEGMAVRAQYRNAWPRLNTNFQTTMFSMEVQEPDISAGLGLFAMNSSEGGNMLITNNIGAIYSHRLLIIPRQFFMQAGFSASYVQKQIDYSNLVFSDNLDPIYGNVNGTSFQKGPGEKVSYPDFGTGAVGVFNLGKGRRGKPLTTNTFGLAFHHLTQPNVSFLDGEAILPIKTVVHFSSVIPLTNDKYKEFLLAPAIIYENQRVTETFSAGVNLVKEPLYMGLWFRNKNFLLSSKSYDALILLMGFNTDLGKDMKLRFGYSYDLTVSKLNPATAGSHEISIILLFDEMRFIKRKEPSLRMSERSNKECFNKF
jgi:type IX secretion system PorP/SprF family membrane protein